MELKIDLDVEQLGKEIGKFLLMELPPLLSHNDQGETLLTKQGLAEYLEVSESWINDRIRDKEIPHIKLGHHVRFNEKEINQWLKSLSMPVINPRQAKLKTFKLR
jgi:excisionase family DNA binding protein